MKIKHNHWGIAYYLDKDGNQQEASLDECHLTHGDEVDALILHQIAVEVDNAYEELVTQSGILAEQCQNQYRLSARVLNWCMRLVSNGIRKSTGVVSSVNERKAVVDKLVAAVNRLNKAELKMDALVKKHNPNLAQADECECTG